MNGPFYKRAGKWKGSIDFLLACGFVGVTASTTTASSDKADEKKKAESITITQLKLLEENENISQLLTGRKELINMAVNILGMECNSFPKCPIIADDYKAGDEKKVGGEMKVKVSAVEEKKKGASSNGSLNASTTGDGEMASGNKIGESTDKKQPNSSSAKKESIVSKQPKPAKLSASPKSLSLEEIQRMAHKERKETIIEAKRLNEEQKKSASSSNSTAAAVESAKKQQREAEAEAAAKLKAATAELEEKQQKLQEQQRQDLERRTSDRRRASNDSSAAAANKLSLLQITDTAASSIDHPALNDEMTNLLDEIENELNDNWFDEGPDHDNDDKDETDKETYVNPSTDTASLCEHENEELVASSDVDTSLDNISIASPKNNNETRVRLEQHHVTTAADTAAETNNTDDDNGTDNNVSDTIEAANKDTEPPMHLSETVEKLVESSTENNISSATNHTDSAKERKHTASVADKDNSSADIGHVRNKSASDLLDELESQSVIGKPNIMNDNDTVSSNQQSKEKKKQSLLGAQQQQQKVADIDVQPEASKTIVKEVQNKATDEDIIQGNGTHINTDDDDDYTPPPLSSFNSDGEGDGYTDLFKNIPLPDGEFSSTDTEDVRRFCQGFELCHRSLFSIWPMGGTMMIDNKGQLPPSQFCSDNVTEGLSNITRTRLIWEDEGENNNARPVIFVPLVYVYTAWTCILGLKSNNNSSIMKKGGVGAQQGKMYSWLVSNHRQLSVFDDDLPINESLKDNYTHLLDTSIAVCNYVCKSLRDIGLVSIYKADTAEGPPPQSSLFVGIDSKVFDECIQKRGDAGIVLDERSLHGCHASLAQLVYPKILSCHHTCGGSTVVWYSTRHAVGHQVSSGSLETAKSLLLDNNFIRLRLDSMGLLGGTTAHCRDCSQMDIRIAESVDEWRRKQLQAADVKRDQTTTSPLDDYGNHGTRAPNVESWKEDHFKILCAVSDVLRTEASKVSSSSDAYERRTIYKDIGNAMQMIGECIGNIGVYRAQEMEHYEEALRLKSEAYGDDQNHPDIADILVSFLYSLFSSDLNAATPHTHIHHSL